MYRILLVSIFFWSGMLLTASEKYNVLFIAVDDLRPELNCYGASYMQTPNIDKLAQRGVLFKNAYCQQAVCAVSRNSIMTGLRPDAMGIYDLGTFFRTKVPDVVTLPQQFINNGYTTEAVGKIYHVGHGNKDDDLSWSVPAWNYKKEVKSFKSIHRGDTVSLESDFPKIDKALLPYYCSKAPEEQMTDAVITKIAVERIKVLKESEEPFFMAVGYKNPHLPFVSPKKYWDMYDPDEIEIPKRKSPQGMPSYSLVTSSGELRKYYGIPSVSEAPYLSDDLSRNLIHGYRAAVSMIDAQVGVLLHTLEDLGIAENTIIVLWGDHGWKLGEYGLWCKHSNCELDTHSPLIISAPQYNKNIKTNSLAEFVDVYPTLCELAGLSFPSHLEGQSLVPILKDPLVSVNSVAISQYPRGKALRYDEKKEMMGYSATDGKYRFVRWQSYENPEVFFSKELYDHQDSRLAEVNLAGKKKYKSIMDALEEQMDTELKKYKVLKSYPEE